MGRAGRGLVNASGFVLQFPEREILGVVFVFVHFHAGARADIIEVLAREFAVRGERGDVEDRKIEKELWPDEERMCKEYEWKNPLWGKRTRVFDEITGKYYTKK